MDDQGKLHELLVKAEFQQQQQLLGRSQLVLPDGNPVPDTWTTFQVGELVPVKGRTFKVAWVSDAGVLLEPVPVLLPVPDGEKSL